MAAKKEDEDSSFIEEIRSFMTDADKFLELDLNPWDTNKVAPCMEVFHRQIENYDAKYSVPIKESIKFLKEKGFLKVEQIVFIVHGFSKDITCDWMYTMKDAILKDGDKTVCVCGWGGGAKLFKIEYLQSVMNTQTAGKWFGEFAKAIKKEEQSIKIWGIGHSLGAHVLGWAGHYSNKSFNRITGLDPAGPAYEEAPSLFRSLNKDDATEMVDVIHTDGCGPSLAPVLHLGTLVPLGNIDFYPNFGAPPPDLAENPIHFHKLAPRLLIQSITEGDKFKCSELLNGTPGFQKLVKSLKPGDGFAMLGYHADRSDCQHKGLWYLKCDSSETFL